MAEITDDGWHLVVAHPATEIREEKQIAEWERSKGHWSGYGKHPDATQWTDYNSIKSCGRQLGIGRYGTVERITYRTVTMARKYVKLQRGITVEQLREEARAMERLAHKHILKLVGTYTIRRNSLYLLLYPVAVCDLSNFLEDIDDIRTQSAADPEDAFQRLQALELRDVGTIEDLAQLRGTSQTAKGYPRTATAVGFLQQILGCITDALAYCHERKIRHRDLKPKNILLSPGRVYLADFGISRDVKDSEDTITSGRCGTISWIAPEVYDGGEDYRMSRADVWSLGSIFLNIATILYGETKDRFDNIMKGEDWQLKYEMLPKYLRDLRTKANAASLENQDQPNFNCKHIVSLIEQMLQYDPDKRPNAYDVNEKLLELGGLDQIYHLSCCHKNNAHVSKVINNKLKTVYDNSTQSSVVLAQLTADIEAKQKRIEELESINKTWQQRLEKERKHAGEQYKALQEKHNREFEARKNLEILVLSMQKPSRRPGSQNRGRKRGISNIHMNPHSDVVSNTNGNGDVNSSTTKRTLAGIVSNSTHPLPQHRASKVPIPTRPATPISAPFPTTPIRPSLPRDPHSATSTLRSSFNSTFSKAGTQTHDSMSSVSSETLRSTSPESPIGGERRRLLSVDKNGSVPMVMLPPGLAKARSDVETLKMASASGKPSWAKMVARSASKV